MKSTGEIEAVSIKEIETKRGPAKKYGYKIKDGEWLNSWKDFNLKQGDYVEYEADKNNFGLQLKTANAITKPAGITESNNKSKEQIARTSSLYIAIELLKINKVENISEVSLMTVAEKLSKYILNGLETDFTVTEEEINA